MKVWSRQAPRLPIPRPVPRTRPVHGACFIFMLGGLWLFVLGRASGAAARRCCRLEVGGRTRRQSLGLGEGRRGITHLG